MAPARASAMDWELRVATPADAPAVRSIYAPFVEDTPVSFEVEPPSTAEMAERIETTLRTHPWLVCEAEGEVLGYAAADSLRSTPPYRWTAELSVYVAERVHGRGIGTELYASLLDVLCVQGFRNAYAVVTLPNPASERLHERLGFESAGTFPAVGYKQGAWHDVQWWHRPIGDHVADPEPPTPLPQVEADALRAALEAGG